MTTKNNTSAIECKSCHKAIDDIVYTGAVLFVEGVATIGDDGIITALGPARAISTIRAGAELNQGLAGMILRCPSCGAEGGLDLFEVHRRCFLSGGMANLEFRTPIGTTIWIDDSLVGTAAKVFTEDNARWDTPVIVEEL